MAKIEIYFPSEAMGQSKELENWLSHQDFSKDITLNYKSQGTKDSLGAVEILQVILASTVLIELIKAIGDWIKANRIKSTIEVEYKGKKVKLNLENIKDERRLLDQINKIVGNVD